MLRKFLIVFNAGIGVYTVFSIAGVGSESILFNFVGMGYTYIDLLLNFTKRLFNWFFDLFDYKVIPKFPNNSGSAW